jgi:hypothetical protein
MPTVKAQNAAFDVAKKEVEDWARALLPTSVPFIGNVQQMAIAKLESPQGTQYLLKLTHDMLTAAEAADAKSS